MPTFATRPSLEATQAVGALLLHQFARQRFLDAGIDEDLIREAEDREHLDSLAATLLQENTDLDKSRDETNNTSQEQQTGTPRAANGSCLQQTISSPNQSVGDQPTDSEADNSSFHTSANNTTVRSDGHSRTERASELFHSMVGSSMNETPTRPDRSIYHSMNLGSPQISGSPFEQLQTAPCFASYGKELRRIADEFEKSRLRANVKERAEQVNLLDITKESFVKLLEELFQEKITREKIVILFFFCTDVALRAAVSAQKLVVKLLGWSFSYIVDRVCSFVHQLGGWDKVLFYNFIFNQLPPLMISCCALMAMLWLGINIKRSLRS